MRLNIAGEEYVVRFEHDSFDKWTTASLYKIDFDETGRAIIPETPVQIEYANCHYKDIFTKKTGRKVAFARLLEWMSKNRFMLTKEQRTEIWNQYFQEFKK